jgi:hypothetical protein
VSEIAKAHGGSFGMGITYARAMGIGRTSK